VILVAGIDLSVGSVVALTATGTAYLLMREGSLDVPLIGEVQVSQCPPSLPSWLS